MQVWLSGKGLLICTAMMAFIKGKFRLAMDPAQRNRLQERSTELAAVIVFVLQAAQFENAINTGFFVLIELFLEGFAHKH